MPVLTAHLDTVLEHVEAGVPCNGVRGRECFDELRYVETKEIEMRIVI